MRLFAERRDFDQVEAVYRCLRVPKLGGVIPSQLLDARAGPLVIWRGRPFRVVDVDWRTNRPVLTPILPTVAGGALSFNGTTAMVSHGDINAIDGAAALTVACWVAPTDVPAGTHYYVADKGSHGGIAQVLGLYYANGGNVVSILGTGAASAYGFHSPGYAGGAWHHNASVFDGAGALNADRLKLYWDGVSQTLTFSNTIPASLQSDANALYIGRDGADATYGFNGALGLVKIWTAALSANQVTAEKWNYDPQRWANLILWSHYDDGTAAKDYSGVGNNGTVTAATATAGPPGVSRSSGMLGAIV